MARGAEARRGAGQQLPEPHSADSTTRIHSLCASGLRNAAAWRCCRTGGQCNANVEHEPQSSSDTGSADVNLEAKDLTSDGPRVKTAVVPCAFGPNLRWNHTL
mmetsp:Transcript_54476/g.128574  ORF Transcript_54476/g.128574 Transcript_54476/m.128574 type:complete len:103 (+) Transcript_54476:1213-1521(+)